MKKQKIKFKGRDESGNKIKGTIEIKDKNDPSGEVEGYQEPLGQSFSIESNGKILTITIAE